MHCSPRALSFAWHNAGNNMAARIAMMAITTSSSIKVKPPGRTSGAVDKAGNSGIVRLMLSPYNPMVWIMHLTLRCDIG